MLIETLYFKIQKDLFKIFSLFRFVLYQLSKNLNRPFFVDFLTHLSIRYTESGGKLDEEDPEETGWNFLCFENNTKKLYSIPVNRKSAYFPFSFSSIQNWNWAFRKMDISILDKMALIILAFNFREPFSIVEAELHSQVKRLWHRPGNTLIVDTSN